MMRVSIQVNQALHTEHSLKGMANGKRLMSSRYESYFSFRWHRLAGSEDMADILASGGV